MRNIASLRSILGLMILPVSLAMGISASWAIVVNNTNNSGPGSLRQAMTAFTVLPPSSGSLPLPVTDYSIVRNRRANHVSGPVSTRNS